MSNTFYWHDYETTGVNPRIDRPNQFAGIRTDYDLNIIGEPLVEYCQPPLDILPQPMAAMVTGITPQLAEEQGLPEPEFIRQIVAELGAPGTCGVGYNTLRFDDEVTRYTLWRNFREPYSREWKNGCSRWDLIDVVRMTYALRPEGIEWPTHEDGKPSFRLEQLTAANGIGHANAHDALSDVHATIAMAKLIKDTQPRLFSYALENKTKQAARQLLDLNSHAPAVHISSKFPADKGCLSLIMPLCPHPTNNNAVLVYDLREDPSEMLELSPEDIHERIFTPRDSLPEGVQRVGVKAIHVNKCPVLAPVKTLTEQQAERVQLDMAACRAHWKLIHDDIDRLNEKLTAVFQLGEFAANDDPEQDLYGGFLSEEDRRLCDQIPEVDPSELEDWSPPFRDPRLHEMLFRYRARNFPQTLNQAEQDEWQNFRAKRIEFAPDGGLTLQEYNWQIDELRKQYSDDSGKISVLDSLKQWGEKLAP